MAESYSPPCCDKVIKGKKTGLVFLHPTPGHIPSDLKILVPFNAWHWDQACTIWAFRNLTDPIHCKRSGQPLRELSTVPS